MYEVLVGCVRKGIEQKVECTPLASKVRRDSYKLRYKVYFEEMGLQSPNACTKTKEIRDDIDQTAVVINYYKGDCCAATLRANILSDGSAGIFESLYNVDQNIAREKQAVLTKLIVDKKHRKSRATFHLFREACLIGLFRDIRFAYIDCVPELQSIYKKLGYVVNGEPFTHYETGYVVPMKFDYQDIEYLRAIKSPCASFYDEFHNSIKFNGQSFSSKCVNTWSLEMKS